jgi:hypothetical protein
LEAGVGSRPDDLELRLTIAPANSKRLLISSAWAMQVQMRAQHAGRVNHDVRFSGQLDQLVGDSGTNHEASTS